MKISFAHKITVHKFTLLHSSSFYTIHVFWDCLFRSWHCSMFKTLPLCTKQQKREYSRCRCKSVRLLLVCPKDCTTSTFPCPEQRKKHCFCGIQKQINHRTKTKSNTTLPKQSFVSKKKIYFSVLIICLQEYTFLFSSCCIRSLLIFSLLYCWISWSVSTCNSRSRCRSAELFQRTKTFWAVFHACFQFCQTDCWFQKLSKCKWHNLQWKQE